MGVRHGLARFFTLLACAWFAASGPDALAASQEPAWRLGIAAGYGERSNPLIQSQDIPVAIDVDIAWFGRRFFFDNGDVGYTFADEAAGTASLVARLNSDRVFFSKTNTRLVTISATGAVLAAPVQLTPPDRSFAVEAGIEYLIDGRLGRLGLSGFRDVSATHDGFAIEVDYGYAIHGRRWTLEPGLMLRYKSRALNDYYWGVREDEASAALPAYRAGDGINLQASLRGSYYLTGKTRLVGAFTVERLNDSAARSPLVVDHAVLGWFGGIAYRF
jgi:outer membrane protein